MNQLNDNDVNRLFGWAISKVKKKYKRLNKNGSLNNIYEGKKEWLDQMSMFVQDIINDQDYIRLYYANDDCIRNRGSLTLIHPIQGKDFSKILKLLKISLEEYDNQNDTPISDKDIIKNMMKSKMNTERNNYVKNICLGRL